MTRHSSPDRPRRSYPDAPTVDEVEASRRPVTIHVRLTAAEAERLRALAAAAGVTVSEWVRRALARPSPPG